MAGICDCNIFDVCAARKRLQEMQRRGIILVRMFFSVCVSWVVTTFPQLLFNWQPSECSTCPIKSEGLTRGACHR